MGLLATNGAGGPGGHANNTLSPPPSSVLSPRNISRSSTGSRLQNSFSVEVAQALKAPMAKVFIIWFIISCGIIALNTLIKFGANDAVFVGSLLSLIGTILILFSASNSDDHERKVTAICYCLMYFPTGISIHFLSYHL